MSDDEYVPLVERTREPESRVHEELTRRARERLITIIRFALDQQSSVLSRRKKALEKLMMKIGRSEVLLHQSSTDSDMAKPEKVEQYFFLKGGTVNVLTYIKILMADMYRYEDEREWTGKKLNSKIGDPSDWNRAFEKIQDVLITEGLLWEMEWADEGGIIQFVPLESEAMEEMDEKVQALAEKEPWGDALKGYNAAFERYLNGDFDDTLVTKLYNSIEEVLQTICVDLEGWTDDRDRSHGYYLDLLNEHDVYDANGITAPELNQLLDSLEKMVSKVGNDRKQRHAYHDRAYCTLLIHQVGAYLYFLISRYDDYKN